MSHLNITERSDKSVIILDLSGKIRMGEESVELRRAIRLQAEAGEKKILLNMADVSYMDSSGLGELVGGYVALKKIGGEIKLAKLPEKILELMTLTKLLTIFEVYESDAQAVASFDNPPAKAASHVSRLV